MLSFDDLVEGLMKADDCEVFLSSFFCRNNYKNYDPGYLPDKDEARALKMLFTDNSEIYERIEDVLEDDPFCKEAFYGYMAIAEDLFLKYRFDFYYKQAVKYADMSIHQKVNYIQILEYYAQFLYDIDNITGVVRIRNLIYKLNKDRNQIDELCELYFLLENADDFYRLYLYNDFTLLQYLYLIVTLLKHEENTKAKEVIGDMLDKIEYADYLDHLYDLNRDDPKQNDVFELVEKNYDKMVCIPELFVFITKVKEDRHDV